MIKLNGYEIYPTIFPDGTSQVWKLTFDYKEFQSYNLVWDFESEGEIVHLYQLMNLLKHETAPKKTTLYMPITREGDDGLAIHTLEGTMRPKIGDYVVQGPEGEFWFVNGVIFEKTYEEIDADS